MFAFRNAHGSCCGILAVIFVSFALCMDVCKAVTPSLDWIEVDDADSEVEKLVLEIYGAKEGGPIDSKTGQQMQIQRVKTCNKDEAPDVDSCINAANFPNKFKNEQGHYEVVLVSEPDLVKNVGQDLSKPNLLKTWGERLQFKVVPGSLLPNLGGTTTQNETLERVFNNILPDERFIVFDSKTTKESQLIQNPDWLPHESLLWDEDQSHILSLGGVRSGIGFHMHGDTWLLSLKGRKRWFVYPPGTAKGKGRGNGLLNPAKWAELVLPSLSPSQRPLTFIQYPGEVVFLPQAWVHLTVNLDEVLAIGKQSVFADDDLPFDEFKKGCDHKEAGDRDPEACEVYALRCNTEECRARNQLKLDAEFLEMALETDPYSTTVAEALEERTGGDVFCDLSSKLTEKEQTLHGVDNLTLAYFLGLLTEHCEMEAEQLVKTWGRIDELTKNETFANDYIKQAWP